MAVVPEDKPVLQTKPFWLESGLSEYTNSENPGFKAALKVLPEDFVVTELNSEGELVVLDNYETPEGRGCESLALSTRKRKVKENYLAPTLRDEVTPLQEMITNEQYRALEEMATSYKQSLTPDPIHLVNLGPVDDKQRRAHLHNAVRLAFPVLITAIKRNEQAQPCVLVHSDPKYVKLLEVLTNPVEAEQLLVFSSVRSPPGSVMRLSQRPKDQRTKIHHMLNLLYGKFFVTNYVGEEKQSASNVSTVSDGEEAMETKKPRLEEDHDKPVSAAGGIEVRVRRKRSHNSMQEGCVAREKEDADIYTKFVLKKRLVETNHALQLISDSVRCSLCHIKLQGKKDKYGITVQEASIKNVRPAQLLSSRAALLKCGIDVGNCKYTTCQVQLGGHSGNHFDVTLKSLRCHGEGEEEEREAKLADIVHKALESVKADGFINYFGLQRLGPTFSYSGPRVGLALLRNNLKEAVELILTENPKMSTEAKDLINKGEYRKAAELLSDDLVLQRLIIKSFVRFKGHSEGVYLNAFMSIPLDTRSFYVQCFCSVLWNHMASYRIREYGLKLVEGDLVLQGMNAKWWERRNNPTAERIRTWVHSVSAEEVREKRYSVQDVVLPVIGSSIMLPKNKVGDKVTEMMALAGLTFASFRKSRLCIHHAGVYRHLLAYPRNLSWSFTRNPQASCSKPSGTVTLGIRSMLSEGTLIHPAAETNKILSVDAERTDAVEIAPSLPDSRTEEGKSEEVVNVQVGTGESSLSQGQERPALNLKFELGKNMFATMLVRELIKSDI